MINAITRYIISNRDELSSEPDLCVAHKKDKSLVVMDFVDIHRDKLSNKTIKSKDVYASFIQWIDTNGYTNYISHTKLTRGLIKAYGVLTLLFSSRYI